MDDETPGSGPGPALAVAGATARVTTAVGSLPGLKTHSGNVFVFFKPVDNNMAYQTFLGTGMNDNFDFVMQTFVARADIDAATRNLTEVHIGDSGGPPSAMKLSNLTFDVLSSKLMVWESGSTCYHISDKIDMWPG